MADIKDFKLPDLGEGLEDGEIVEWHVAEGEQIDLNQTVASVETAKAVVEIPSPFAGIVVERVGEVGETLEVGTVFLRIDVDVAGGAVADDGEAPAADGDQSSAQGGFETGGAAAQASAPDADAAPTEALADERRPSGALDADEEPQPLVGYGQGKAGARRRRRRGAAAAANGEDAAEAGGEAAAAGTGATAGAAGAAASAAPLTKPPVRKLAKDLGVDLAELAPGSGPDGIITREDVQAAADRAAEVAAGTPPPPPPPVERAPAGATSEAPTQPPPAAPVTPSTDERAGSVPGFRGRMPGEVEQVRGIRKRIVEKMETSRREIPEATCSRDADLTELWELRHTLTQQANDDGLDVRITPFVVVMRAALVALRRFPTLNARFEREAGEIHLLDHVNLGFAADTDRGLVVPNIKDARSRSLAELASELQRLAAAARDGSIGPGDLTGGTFTVNNYGAFGNDDGDPIINHPEAAILGVGAIRERPWVVPSRSGDPDAPGELAVRRVARFTLAFDHRVCDGGEAGRFVTYVADLCEQPARLLLHA